MRVKGAGGLQMRAVVRDAPSGRVGSGSQFLDVPAVGRDRLALSSLLMQGDVGGDQPARPVTTDGAPSQPLASLHAAPADDAPVTSTALTGVPDTLLAEPTIRIFRPGSRAIHACEIYSGLRPQHRLSMSVALLREGRIVYQSPREPVLFQEPRQGPARVPIAGSLALGADMPEGLRRRRVRAHPEGRRRRRLEELLHLDVLAASLQSGD